MQESNYRVLADRLRAPELLTARDIASMIEDLHSELKSSRETVRDLERRIQDLEKGAAN